MTYGYTFSSPKIHNNLIWLIMETTLNTEIPGTSCKEILSYEYYYAICDLVIDIAYPYEVVNQCRK